MTTIERLHILMAGGGTGGHVMPIKAIIKSIDTGSYPAARLYRYGQSQGLENNVCQDINKTLSEPVYFRSILSGKIRRHISALSTIKNIRDMIKVAIGTLQAIRYMHQDNIDVVRCKGGYVAGPVIVASRVLRIPLVVHESDTRMGLINRIASRYADAIFTAFEGVHPQGKVIGQLLSSEIVSGGSRDDFNHLLKHRAIPEQTQILVMGGSQGSESLYISLMHIMEKSPDLCAAFSFIVVGGILSKNIQQMFASYDNVTVVDFLKQDDLRLCYQYCDIAITRAGTTSLAEQKLRDMLLIMIPIPWTHDQKTNAEYYVKSYGDIYISQDETLQKQLTLTLSTLTKYKKKTQYTDKLRGEYIEKSHKKLIQTLFSMVAKS